MRPIVRALLAASLLGSAVAVLAPVSASAADKPSPEVAKYLLGAQKALAAKDLDGALGDVKQAQAVSERTPYDDYLINSFLAEIYIEKNDYASADAPMEAAADSPVLPDDQKKSAISNAFQLAMSAAHYQKALGYAQQLQAMNALDTKFYSRVALAYYELKDMPHAQQYAQMSIDASKAAGQPPEKNRLKSFMKGAMQKNDKAGTQTALENIAVQYNQADNWSRLIDFTLGTKGLKELDELNLLRLKFLIPGAMRAEDYDPLASVANLMGYATESKNVLEKGIHDGAITAAQAGPSYVQARNGAATDARELNTIAAQAAHAKTGEADIKLAEDYWGYGRYADAEVAARRAISKGGMKDPHEAPTLLGMYK